jgi:hypothetical protein
MSTEGAAATAPRVFLSYSHDDVAHKDWVRRLGEDLRRRGVDVILDQWEVTLGADLPAFMEDSVSGTERVLMICTDQYVSKANKGVGGVGYEKGIATGEIVRHAGTDKFIPVLRNNAARVLPTFLSSRVFIDFSDDATYSDRLDELVRDIFRLRANPKPPLGPPPTVVGPPPLPQAGGRPTGLAATIAKERGPAWAFVAPSQRATVPARRATFEAAFGLVGAPMKVQPKQLVEALRLAEIHTFGWPIGLVVDGVDDAAPQPVRDGVLAKVMAGHRSGADYWKLTSSGDFYTLMSLFEDDRDSTAIFFDTQIVRTTELLQLSRNLYTRLSVATGAELCAHVRYVGFKGRRIAAANRSRHFTPFPKISAEDEYEESVILRHPASDEDIVASVRQLLEPFFALFGFFQAPEGAWGEIARSFLAGRIV